MSHTFYSYSCPQTTTWSIPANADALPPAGSSSGDGGAAPGSSQAKEVTMNKRPMSASGQQSLHCCSKLSHSSFDKDIARLESVINSPIQSGNYWYDTTSGSWGVLGGPCLGFIRAGLKVLCFRLSSGTDVPEMDDFII